MKPELSNQPPDPQAEALDRYLSGESPPEETARMDAYFAAHPDRERAVRTLFRALIQSGKAPPDVTRAWATMRARIEQDLALAESGEKRETRTTQTENVQTLWKGIPKGYTLRRGVWSAAAALALGLVVLVVGWTAGAHHSSQRVARSNLAYTTGNGERATITLPDGGTVALNVASRLDVPLDYMAGNHTVRLIGEGLFTVPHHAGSPFTVLAGVTATRVLGTSFVVRRYATDLETMVAVREGKVAVGGAIVTAAHMVEVGRTGVSRVRPSDASPFTFATGVLTMNGVPLSAAIAELDRWYDADIRLGSQSLASHKIGGEFPAGSLANLVQDLEFTMGVRVVRDGRTLTLFPEQ